MSHLLKFRKGWQSEHIAKFILSKFSFIAEPSTVADDLGTDFFCTLFNIQAGEYLVPQNSFAIQIKSDHKNIDITKKVSYIQGLEIPLFVGVVNKEDLTLRIYSGESIPHFFSTYTGLVKTHKYSAVIKLLEDKDYENRGHNFISSDPVRKVCYLEFPKIVEINAEYDYKLNSQKLDELFYVCRLIQYNLSCKLTHSYLYHLHGEKGVNIYAGEDSAKTYRANYLDRLAEVFHNLKWIYEHKKNDFDFDDYKIHKATYLMLVKKYGEIAVLKDVYSKLENRIHRDSDI
jgi:hypothetical protein